MRVTVLGTGTSTGVPIPGCSCGVCSSEEPRNKRLRCSIFVEDQKGSGGVLVDTSPDLRIQALRSGITDVKAVLYTHTHADHVHGIDDLRSFNFINKRSIPLYGLPEHTDELLRKFSYCFIKNTAYEGGAPPQLELKNLEPAETLSLDSIEIVPLLLHHGSARVLGYRFNSFAYLTDCSHIPEESGAKLRELDVLIIDGLRERPHKTHFNIEQAIEQIEILRPGRAYLTHMSHEVDYETTNTMLAQASSIPIELAYDGLTLDL